MISTEEWNGRIDAFIREENEKAGRVVPVRRIFCQDDTDRSGGGIYNETVTVDTIGRFARALGDSNPLFSDPRYQPGRGAAGLFQAPPLLECCICSTFIGGRMPRLRGISVFDAGTKWERFLPIMPGDSFHAQTTFLGVREITKTAEGTDPAARLLIREHRIDLMNQRDEHVSSLTARSVIKCVSPLQEDRELPDRNQMSDRDQLPDRNQISDSADEPDKNSESEKGRPHYTKEELEGLYANLDAQLAGAFRRGAVPRYWEDVEIGEKLPEQLAGPYDESDGQALMAAIGAANAFASKWASIRFRKGQGITDPETGAHRHPIDRHNSDVMARVQGLPRAIVSGIHTQALLAKSVGDWMGDAGFLRTLDCRCRRPLFFGDLSIQSGIVAAKYEKDGKYYVKLQMQAVRQDSVVHTTAEALVELPSRRTFS